MQFQINETCPRCRKPVTVATVEPHPSRPAVALHSFECVDCGPVITKSVSLQTDKSIPGRAA
jgi:hypothetical protein